MNIFDYIDETIKSFGEAPVITEYQAGYEKAYENVWNFLNEEKVNNNEPA